MCQSLHEVRIFSENEAMFEGILSQCRIHSLIQGSCRQGYRVVCVEVERPTLLDSVLIGRGDCKILLCNLLLLLSFR